MRICFELLLQCCCNNDNVGSSLGAAMNVIEGISHEEIGRRLTQVRESAGFKQGELARKITWSPAVLSRIESGERPITREELEKVMEAIGTPEALQLSRVLSRDWTFIPRPPLDHPDQDLLWDAEEVCRELVELKNRPEVRHAFERRLTEYIEDLQRTANLILKREHEIAFIGPLGIGKSTAICKLAKLEVVTSDGAPPAPVLEAGGGGVTVCEVHLRTGSGYGLLIEPCTDDEIRAYVSDFAEHILKAKANGATSNKSEDDDHQGISQEIDRAVRNLAGFKIRREKDKGGEKSKGSKINRRDEAKELANIYPSIREYVVEVLARMELHRRDRRDIWYDASVGKPPLIWLKEIFEQVNNGRHPDFSLPKRIEVIVPQPLLGDCGLTLRLVDTKGIDRTVARADLEKHLDEPHTLALLCSSFNDAPSADARLLLERAKAAGVRNLDRNTALLILPHPNQALAVKDETGARVETVEEGYELKGEKVEMALEPLGLQNVAVGFFNAFGDEPARLRDLILDCLEKIRNSFREHIQDATRNSRILLENHEKEQVQEVLRAAARMMRTWILEQSRVPAINGSIQDSLLSQIQIAHASTIRATVRRKGAWHNLSYVYHLGYGARRLAVLALEPLVNKFKGTTEVMEANPDYEEAKDLIKQARQVLDVAFEELLRKAQIMGETAFTETLEEASEFWANCENEWGQGYRMRIAALNQQWFNTEPSKKLEKELSNIVIREWDTALERLSSLLETDTAA